MPKTNAERSREYRRKKKANKIKKPPKSSTERVREFRARRKQSVHKPNESNSSNASNNVYQINQHDEFQNSLQDSSIDQFPEIKSEAEDITEPDENIIRDMFKDELDETNEPEDIVIKEERHEIDEIHEPDDVKHESVETYEVTHLQSEENLRSDNVRDKYSVYCEHIANRLRSSGREDYEIYFAQRDIDEIVFNLSIGSYARRPPPYQTIDSSLDPIAQHTDVIIPTTIGPNHGNTTTKLKEEPSDFPEII